MVTIAIAAVLAGLAAPSFRELIANNRLKSHISALQTSLMLARNEAINRNRRVVVCKSADQASCATTGDWQQGWIVFVDADDDASVDAGETVLQKVEALSGSFILQGRWKHGRLCLVHQHRRGAAEGLRRHAGRTFNSVPAWVGGACPADRGSSPPAA